MVDPARGDIPAVPYVPIYMPRNSEGCTNIKIKFRLEDLYRPKGAGTDAHVLRLLECSQMINTHELLQLFWNIYPKFKPDIIKLWERH